jgi:hypothetical protein
VLLGSRVLDEVEKIVVSFAALAGSWCFLGLSSWVELDQTGGHRHPKIECFWSLPLRRSAVTKIEVLWVRYKSREILLGFERIKCLVQDKVTDDVPIVADAP